MKKLFPLQEPGKERPRVVDAVKHEVRKYVKREHRKALPEGFDMWTFACKVGTSAATAAECALGDISAKIDQVESGGADAVYIEIIATPTQRPPNSETPAGH